MRFQTSKMKPSAAVPIALCLLFLSVCFVTVNTVVLTRMISRFEVSVEATPAAASGEDIEDLQTDFYKICTYVALTVDHDDLTDIRLSLAEWAGAAGAGSEDDCIIAKSRLLDAIKHLSRLAGVGADSIL